MRIERSLFLVLTGSLAGACHVYVDEPASRTATAPAPPAPPAAPASAQPAPAAAPATAAAQPAPAAPKPPPRVIPIHLGGALAPAHSGGTTPAPAATCLDANSVTVPDCATVKAPDTTCAPFPFPAQRCATYKTFFDPKVAAQAISCMSALSSKQVCDATQTYNCGKAALAQACPDPEIGQLCNIAANACKATPADCTSLLSGLNEQGKQQVAQCVAQGCQGGLYSCVEGLH
jgi:hypothetical protein